MKDVLKFGFRVECIAKPMIHKNRVLVNRGSDFTVFRRPSGSFAICAALETGLKIKCFVQGQPGITEWLQKTNR